ncbi:MAG: alpha/beta hydrolase [Micrococcales bacterium]|nr:alpha/beta hydrolase [Micrococcales bacterium]
MAMVVLAVLGAVLGPQWDPEPLTSSLRVATADTAVGGAPDLEAYPVRERTVTVELDGAQVRARVTEPVDAPGPRPGMVFVHGAGTADHGTAFVDHTHALAAAGIVTMVPDKRTDTYTMMHRDYVAMADDYLRSVDVLRAWPGVDPTRVGVYAVSEGAWIAPVMAVDDPDLAFLVLVSAPVVPPREQAAFAVDSYLRNTGVPRGVFRAIPRAVGLSLPGAFEYVDFDVSGYQQQVRQPVLVAYGTGDASMPIVQAAEQIVADAAQAGNDQVTVRYYAGGDHGLNVDGRVVPVSLVDVGGWVLGLPQTATAPPRIAGARPEQQFRAGPVPMPRWLRDGNVLLVTGVVTASVVVGAGLLGFGHHGVGAWRRRRALAAGRPVPTRNGITRSLAVPLSLCAAGCLATAAALVWYLWAVARLALEYERNPLVVTGGWLVVRVLGLATALVAVVALRAVRVRGPERSVVGVVPWTAVGTAGLACLVLLVVLAYWGVFQLGI